MGVPAADGLYRDIAQRLERGEVDTLAAPINALIALEGATERACVAAAVVLMRQQRWADAERALKEFIASHGETAVVLTNLGKIAAERNDLKGALALARKAVALAPNHPNGLGWWASLSRRVAKSTAEHAAALDAVAKLPGSWRVQLNLADLALEAGDVARALTCLRAAISAAKLERPEALAAAARRLLELGHAKEVTELLGDYRPETDGLPPGLGLLEAYQALGAEAEAGALVPKLQALPGASRARALLEWEERLAKSSAAKVASKQLTLRGVSLYAPLWRGALAGAESWLLPAAAKGRAVAIATFTEATGFEPTPGPAAGSEVGDLSRALPLALAGALREAGVEAYTLVPVVGDVGLPSPRRNVALDELLGLFATGHVPRALITGSFAQGLHGEQQLDLALYDFSGPSGPPAALRSFAKHDDVALFDSTWKRLQRALAAANIDAPGAPAKVSRGYLRALAAALPTFILGARVLSAQHVWHPAGGLETCLAEAVASPNDEATQLLTVATFLQGFGVLAARFEPYADAVRELVTRDTALPRVARLAPLVLLRLGDKEGFERTRAKLSAASTDARYGRWLAAL